MAAIAQSLPGPARWPGWISQFLRDELAPYPGRTLLVTRMVIASTVVMIISMTFKLPYGAFGAIYALILSRESLEATAEAVRDIVIGFAFASAYIIAGLMIALGDPVLRFIWIVVGFVIGFWAMSAFKNYAASTRFGYLIAITAGLWDSHVFSPADKVERTLWAVGVITLASLITLGVEIGFAAFKRPNYLIDSITERLNSVAELLSCYLTGDAVNASAQKSVLHL